MRAPDTEILGKIFRTADVPRTPEFEKLARALIDAPTAAPGNRSANRKYAEQLRQQIMEVSKTLAKVPDDVVLLGLFPPDFQTLESHHRHGDWPLEGDRIQEDDQDPTDDQFNILPIDTSIFTVAQRLGEMEGDAWRQHGALLQSLTKLCLRCEQVAEAPPGAHPNLGYLQYRAAKAARVFMMRVGLTPRVGGAKQNKYRLLAGLFLEAMGGEQNADMVRACRDALELPIKSRTENPPK